MNTNLHMSNHKFHASNKIELNLTKSLFLSMKSRTLFIWYNNCYRIIATFDMNKLMFQKYCRSFYFEVSWILVLVMTFKKLLIWKMPWFLYLHLSRHITTVIGRFCGHYLFLVMQKLGQQKWTLEYASIMWNKDIY